MEMKRLTECLLVFILVIGMVSAGTVTLSGGCTPTVINSNTITFTLSNSGNDSAFNMVLTPFIQTAQATNSTYSINSLGPGGSATINVSVTKVGEPGTSGAYFVLEYQQGTSVFAAVFPCLVHFFSASSSAVLLTENSTVYKNGTALAKVTAINEAGIPIAANVSLVIPPSFSYLSSKFHVVNLTSFGSANVTFALSYPAGQVASYSAAAFVHYLQNGTSYAYFIPFVIKPPPLTSSYAPTLIEGGAAAAVVIVILLIAASLMRKKRKGSGVVQNLEKPNA